MAAPEFFKSAADSLDKLTDILNVGRLIFYTAAGFCALLPAAMIIRMLGCPAEPSYWHQFVSDLVACAKNVPVWVAALVLGFIVADLAFATVMDRFADPRPQEFQKDSYAYSYPRLFSGGTYRKESAAKDYAAWLISEYYRYVEIAVFIPYGLLLSLPVYSLYSLILVVRATGCSEPFVVNAAHFGFALWTFISVIAWTVLWPDFWLPRVAEPMYQAWVHARRAAVAGLQDFIKNSKAQGDAQPSPTKPDSKAQGDPQTSLTKP